MIAQKIKKIAVAMVLSFLFTSSIYAEDLSSYKKSLEDLIKQYETQIQILQSQNEKLKQTLDELNNKIASTSWIIVKPAVAIPKASNTWTIATSAKVTINFKISGNAKYDTIIEKINKNLSNILKEQNISSDAKIWLFEFVEPNSFFISIDDFKNPAWITAFKNKILYSYDKDYNFTIVWLFSLDYSSWYYKTIYWKNPFAKAARIRVKNPWYAWKLLGQASNTTTSSSNWTSAKVTSTTPSVDLWNVTIEMVKNSYSKNKILDALKYSTEYIKKDPNNIEVLRIRYRSFHILWRYNDALLEVQKIEALWWSSFSKVVACDGSEIARLAKNMDLNKKYWDICKAK